jgi:hypothetical protein
MTVVLPSATGMSFATHVVVPEAVPVTPFEVCQVTRATPATAEAVPLIEAVGVATETIAASVEPTVILTGAVACAQTITTLKTIIADTLQIFFMITYRQNNFSID